MLRVDRLLGLLMLSLLLTGCFRDASEDRENPTTAPLLNEFITPSAGVPVTVVASPTLLTVTKTLIPTLTPTPQGQPSSTFPVGGPPIATNTSEGLSINIGTPADTTSDLPATLPIPSFTPRPASSLFGDSGLTPTPSLPTQPVPDGLITPTAFLNLDCVHVVQGGETLSSISLAEGVTLDELVAANPDLGANINALQIGQQLNLPNCVEGQGVVADEPFGDAPVTGSNTTQTATPNNIPAGANTYTVKEGDNPFRIATSNGITLDELYAANPELAGGNALIYAGQVLIIPTPTEE